MSVHAPVGSPTMSSLSWALIIGATLLLVAAVGRHAIWEHFGELARRVRGHRGVAFFYGEATGTPPGPGGTPTVAQVPAGPQHAPADLELERVDLDLYGDPEPPH